MTSAVAALIVDDRYRGNHGIGRYAQEVIPRLRIPFQKFESRLSPMSAWDVVNPQRLTLGPSNLVYSPGFSVGASAAKQIPTVHDLIHLRGPSSSRITSWGHGVYYERVLKPALRRSGHVITVSTVTAKDLADWLDGSEVSVHNAGNGCSESFTADGPRYVSEKPYFLYVGNMKPHKNPRVVFAAMRYLPNYKLVVVANDTAAVSRLAGEHRLHDRQVTVFSGVEDDCLAQLYRGCAALVFPSVIEGFGLPVLEALRCRAPVVYYRGCASVREICEETQRVVDEPDDVRAFAHAMEAAAGSPFESPDLDRYEWSAVAERVSDALTLAMADS